MLTFPETHFHFGGDEYIFAEISKDMRLESNFKAISITREVRNRQIPGVIDVYSANASYLVHFNPDIISVNDLLEILREIDIQKSSSSELNITVRIVDIPIWYDDPITREYSRAFKDRHPDPSLSNFEFVMKVNGFKDKEAFIEAHSSLPHVITMIGFNPGGAYEFPLGKAQDRIIQTPKYISSRTDSPRQAVSMGGAFTLIYPFSTWGGFQLIGMCPVPIYHKKGVLKDFKNSMFLARLGDLWKHRPINESEYQKISDEVEQGTYQFRKKTVSFSPQEYFQKGRSYINELMKGF